LEIPKRLAVTPLLPIVMMFNAGASCIGTTGISCFGASVGLEFQPPVPIGISERILTRTLDLLISVSVIIFLMPMFLIVAVAIKLDSRGPALLTQIRHGFNTKRFKICNSYECPSELTPVPRGA